MILTIKSADRFKEIYMGRSFNGGSQYSIQEYFDNMGDYDVHDFIDIVGMINPVYDSQEETVVEYSSVAFLIDSDKYKADKLEEYSEMAFEKRRAFLPDYKLVNANGGKYDTETTDNIGVTIDAFRAEFYRIKAIIDAAEDQETIDAIIENYPTDIIAA